MDEFQVKRRGGITSPSVKLGSHVHSYLQSIVYQSLKGNQETNNTTQQQQHQKENIKKQQEQ